MRRLLLPAALALVASGAAPVAAAQNREAVRRTPTVIAVERVHHSVVNISTERVVVIRRGLGPVFGRPHDDFFDRLFDDFFGPTVVKRKRVNTPLGSGCVITSDGLVVTNEHVVRRATNIKLSLDAGGIFDGVLVAADPDEDLALVRADTDVPLRAIPLGTSSDLMLGETVIALGNPFGFENSVTSGIISALNREIRVGGDRGGKQFKGLIQTSALINPGNSGGPLVNVLGELVGINVAVVDQAQGIGFAIPIERAREVLAPLLAARQVSEAWPGVHAVTAEARTGARLTRIVKHGPARGRLRVGDVICEADGAKVRDLFDFRIRVVQHRPGDMLSLKIVRDGKPREVDIKLGRMPVPSAKKILHEKFGIAAQDVTPSLARQLEAAVDHGVLVSEVWPDGPAVAAGLKRGDIIVQIAKQRVRNLRDAASALTNARPGDSVFLLVVRKESAGYTRITVRRRP